MSREQLELALDDIRKDISKRGLDHRVINRPKEDTMAKAKKVKSAKAEKSKGGYSATDLAADLGVDSTTLRKALRDSGAKKPGASWNWDSKSAAASAISAVKEQLKGAPAKKSGKTAPKAKAKNGGNKKKPIRKVKASKAAEETSEADGE